MWRVLSVFLLFSLKKRKEKKDYLKHIMSINMKYVIN